jgi:Pectate lyase superfamily protein
MTSKVTAIAQHVRGLIDSRPFGIASVTEFGALNNGMVDCTAAFNAALASPARLVVVPPGFYRITAPLRIPHNTGKWVLGLGGAKSVALTVAMPAEYSGRAVIEYTHDSDRRPNAAGCVLQNLHLIGNDSVCHGVYLQQVAYPVVENVLIEGFSGAGLLLDKCQDGSFNNVALVNCGRTSGDPARNQDTEYAALHLVSTIAHDHCNMLRFRDCQIENNRVSPYVWINDSGPIGIWFDRIHAENATAPGRRDFLRSQGGDCHFSGIAAVGFREGFILEGYGNNTFSDCRDVISVVGPTDVVGSLRMSNVHCGPLSWTSLGGRSYFTNCTIGDLHVRWPSRGPSVFTACSLGKVRIDEAGEAPSGVRFFNCEMAEYTTDAHARDQWLIDCIIQGDVDAAAGHSRLENNVVGGSIRANKTGSSYIPHVKTIHDTAPPTAGVWNLGDKVWHSAPSPDGNVGWVCVREGSPGTWKEFGRIAS